MKHIGAEKRRFWYLIDAIPSNAVHLVVRSNPSLFFYLLLGVTLALIATYSLLVQVRWLLIGTAAFAQAFSPFTLLSSP